MRNRNDPVEYLDLTLLDRLLGEARRLGLRAVSFTGGEVAMYPHLDELFGLCVKHEMLFNFVTNGVSFAERIWPLITQPRVRAYLTGICFSLDGASPKTHDALRGKGTFRKVIQSLTLCRYHHVPSSIKTMVTRVTLDELTDIALLGAMFEVESHSFLFPYPTPALVENDLLPDPAILAERLQWVRSSLARSLRSRIYVEGYSDTTSGLILCSNILQTINVDYQGHQVLCCNLSHTIQEGSTILGREVLADLRQVSLSEGICRHFEAMAELNRARARALSQPLSLLEQNACYWCLKHFGRLEWLRSFAGSPWAAPLMSE